jgi:perosamine synthetase
LADTWIVPVGGLQITERARELVNQVLDSGRLSYGPMTREFERRFAERHDCRYAVFCNSGTSALHIAIACLKEAGGWRDGDEVIVPALTFVATPNMVLINDLTPVFVDVDPVTYNIDPRQIEAAITDRTRAIMPVHLFGQPCEMDPILEIAHRHGLRVVEDSAETMFARYKGRSVGAFGDVGCFSTYIAHLLVTGVGGFATTNSDEHAVVLHSLMNHGRDSIYLNIDDRGNTPEERLKIAEGRFRFVRFGHSFRATELEAAVGLAQLDDMPELIRRRQENAAYLIDRLSQFDGELQLPSWPDYVDHVFMMFPIVIRDSKTRKGDLVSHLEENGVETRDMVPLLNQPIYKERFGDIESRFLTTKWVNESGFYIGCHPYLEEEQLDHVVRQVERFFDRQSGARG